MTERERNLELVRTGLDAFNRQDMPGVTAILDPRIESHVSPRMMNAGTWHGIEGFFEMAGTWYEAWDGLRYEVIDLDAPDDRHVIARLRQVATGRESGVPVEMDVYFLFEAEGGRALRLHIHPDRESALAAL